MYLFQLSVHAHGISDLINTYVLPLRSILLSFQWFFIWCVTESVADSLRFSFRNSRNSFYSCSTCPWISQSLTNTSFRWKNLPSPMNPQLTAVTNWRSGGWGSPRLGILISGNTELVAHASKAAFKKAANTCKTQMATCHTHRAMKLDSNWGSGVLGIRWSGHLAIRGATELRRSVAKKGKRPTNDEANSDRKAATEARTNIYIYIYIFCFIYFLVIVCCWHCLAFCYCCRALCWLTFSHKIFHFISYLLSVFGPLYVKQFLTQPSICRALEHGYFVSGAHLACGLLICPDAPAIESRNSNRWIKWNSIKPPPLDKTPRVKTIVFSPSEPFAWEDRCTRQNKVELHQ